MAGWMDTYSVDILETLREAGIQPGMNVLDFGCGPGRYALPAARMVGTEGVVYAVDAHPAVVEIVKRRAATSRTTSLRTIHTDCDTSLPRGSIDVVLLYDAFHDMRNKEAILVELHRVLRLQGVLSYRDHTLGGEPLLSLMHACGFSLLVETARQLSFHKHRAR
ncbi:MAG TPA: class I SAM-dependent methyltransferase [Spirochaetia bacterium]|nr:class I SAM-dependent methyltransferase [Spirochaetia bacterium]